MRRMALACALVCTCLGAQAEVSVVDDSGATVRLAQPASAEWEEILLAKGLHWQRPP